jgi:hypothetical protein
MNDDNQVQRPDLQAPDYADTLEGAVPGNVAAEHDTAPGADPAMVIGDHTPEQVPPVSGPSVDPSQDEEGQAIRERQVKEYEQDAGNSQS